MNIYLKDLLSLLFIISSDVYILFILLIADRTEFEIGITLLAYFVTVFWQLILHGAIVQKLKEGSLNLFYQKDTILYAIIFLVLVYTIVFYEVVRLVGEDMFEIIIGPILVFSGLAIINSFVLYQQLKASSKEKLTFYKHYVSNHIMVKLPFAFVVAALYIYPNFPEYITTQVKYLWIALFFGYFILADSWYYYIERKYTNVSRQLFEMKKPFVLLSMLILVLILLAYLINLDITR